MEARRAGQCLLYCSVADVHYIDLSLKRWSAKSSLIFVPSLHLFLNSPFLSKFSFFNYFLPSFKTDLELQTEGHDRMLSSPASYFVGLRIIS